MQFPKLAIRAMLAIMAAGLISVSTAQAAITTTGNLNPATDPSTWTTSTTAYIGYSADGTLAIDEGSAVNSRTGYLGFNSGVTGTATVSGTGSKWVNSSNHYIGYNGTGNLMLTNGGYASNTTGYIGYAADSVGAATVSGLGSNWVNSSNLYVGYNGTGRLTIADNGSVVTGKTTYLASNNSVSGSINFSTGGTLTTGSLYASPSQLSGSGTINTSGIVSDIDLVFNASHGLTQTIAINGITTNLSQSGSGDLGAGYLGSGTLTIADGLSVASNAGMLGYNAGSVGKATVSGSGSNWVSSGNSPFYVGYSGSGSLAVSNGGSVSNGNSTFIIGYSSGASGTVSVDGQGSSLTNVGQSYVGQFGTGQLSITNGGSVTFGISGSNSYIGSSSTGNGTVFIDGTGSKLTTGYLYIGNSGGSGFLTIKNGGSLNNAKTLYIGYGKIGSATVDGSGSILSSGGNLFIGASGTGILTITNGASVSTNGIANIGYGGTANGIANINGAGSVLTSSGSVNVGYGPTATGKCSISDGGAISAAAVSINGRSLLTADVGRGSAITVGSGTGTITNNGTIRLVTGAAAANGSYTPISAGTWAGTGTVQALGGIWDNTSHTMTVSDAELALAGRTRTIDTSVTQRLLVIDAATAQVAGASFLGTETSSTISFTASLLSKNERYLLESTADADQQYLGGWEFTADGYTDGDPIYLSLGVGSGYSLGDLNVWHFDGTSWNMFDAADLAYDNTYASFTVNGLSGYAVTGSAPVPIPAAAWLFGTGLMGLFRLRRRMQS